MSILGKAATTLIRVANDGNIGAIDKLVDAASSIDLSKLKNVSREKQKKAKDYSKASDDLKDARRKQREARNSMYAQVNLYEELVMMADEMNVKIAIENDVKPFTSTAVYKTSSQMASDLQCPKKTFYAISTDIDNFDKIKREYQAIIMRIKESEREAIKQYRNYDTLTKKVEQLNTTIEGLKK